MQNKISRKIKWVSSLNPRNKSILNSLQDNLINFYKSNKSFGRLIILASDFLGANKMSSQLNGI
jgi:hypothetical protein